MKVLHEELTATTSKEKQALLSSLQEQFVVIYHQYSCLQMLMRHLFAAFNKLLKPQLCGVLQAPSVAFAVGLAPPLSP